MSSAEALVAPDAVLDALEAEAIHIFREAAGAFRRPVMLYSIGKDSSVLLHLAVKAFAPGKVPFPVLHIDTTWKFQEMIEFRDRTARELGLDPALYVLDFVGVQGAGAHTWAKRVGAVRQPAGPSPRSRN